MLGVGRGGGRRSKASRCNAVSLAMLSPRMQSKRRSCPKAALSGFARSKHGLVGLTRAGVSSKCKNGNRRGGKELCCVKYVFTFAAMALGARQRQDSRLCLSVPAVSAHAPGACAAAAPQGVPCASPQPRPACRMQRALRILLAQCRWTIPSPGPHGRPSVPCQSVNPWLTTRAAHVHRPLALSMALPAAAPLLLLPGLQMLALTQAPALHHAYLAALQSVLSASALPGLEVVPGAAGAHGAWLQRRVGRHHNHLAQIAFLVYTHPENAHPKLLP
eukprot:362713-Chlamydomonas_euryale.AAC.22